MNTRRASVVEPVTMRSLFTCAILAGTALLSPAGAETKTIEVFVALCDNDSQGIAPVPEKIGDGDVPAANLYWGCSDGMSALFKRSPKWKLAKTEHEGSKKRIFLLPLRAPPP